MVALLKGVKTLLKLIYSATLFYFHNELFLNDKKSNCVVQQVCDKECVLSDDIMLELRSNLLWFRRSLQEFLANPVIHWSMPGLRMDSLEIARPHINFLKGVKTWQQKMTIEG